MKRKSPTCSATERTAMQKDDDFDLTTALEKAAFVQRGDVWTVGRHRLMCGDATSSDDVNTLMGNVKRKSYSDRPAV